MADNTLSVSPPLKFDIKTAPRGTTDYDPSATNERQEELLNQYKMHLMRNNIAYVSRHPEIKGIFYWTGKYCYTVRPRDMLGRMAKKFTSPELKFRRQIKKILHEDVFRIERELVESEDEEWDY